MLKFEPIPGPENLIWDSKRRVFRERTIWERPNEDLRREQLAELERALRHGIYHPMGHLHEAIRDSLQADAHAEERAMFGCTAGELVDGAPAKPVTRDKSDSIGETLDFITRANANKGGLR
jgi:hypothetical protein